MKYKYNIRCKMCKTGFNPKQKENAISKLCPDCMIIRKQRYEEYKKANASAI